MLEQIAALFLAGALIPRVVGAVVILVVGWIVAALVSAAVRAVLRRTQVDDRLARAMGGQPGFNTANAVATAVYYLILLFVLVAVFQALNLTLVTQPLTGLLVAVFAFIPNLIGALVLLLIAWVLARVLRTVVTQVLTTARIDERLSRGGPPPPAMPGGVAAAEIRQTAGEAVDAAAAADGEHIPLARTLGEVVYWLVFLLFLPAILGALGLAGLLQPVQVMLDRALGFLPNLIAAGVILVVGLFVARLVQRVVTNVLAAAGADRLGAQVGLDAALGGQRLSALFGLVVYVLIAIPVVTASLDALALTALTQPISNMLNTVLNAIPNVFAAALVLGIAYAVGRFVARLVTGLLAGAGFDTLPARLGIGAAVPPPVPGQRRPSDVAGSLVLAAIILFAAMEAARLLGFAFLANLVAQFLVFAGHLLLGVVIFALGLWIANLAHRAILGSGVDQARLLANLARAAILVLAGTMALREMGLGDEIITLAFGLTLGAIAVAAAIAFGVGGRQVAGRELENWVNSTRARGGGPDAGPRPTA